LEIKVIFEFQEEFYNKIFSAFSHNAAMKRIGEKRFKPNLGVTNESYNIDKGNINSIINSSSNDIFYKIYKNVLDSYEDIANLLVVRIEPVNENILLKGNYLKYSREIGQTPWSHAGVKICFTSVQEEMSKTLNKIFEAPESILHAGGREDRDVRMLGSGRPFIIEIVNPKKRKM
jgi:hypothetical protein